MACRLNGRMWLAAAAALGSCFSLFAHAAGDSGLGEKKFYTCFGCHGVENYRNAYPDYSVPKLRHQNAAYIISALQEYRSGDRPHATMHAQTASLTDQDMEDIAAYLQGPEPVKPSTLVSGTVPTQVAMAKTAWASMRPWCPNHRCSPASTSTTSNRRSPPIATAAARTR